MCIIIFCSNENKFVCEHIMHYYLAYLNCCAIDVYYIDTVIHPYMYMHTLIYIQFHTWLDVCCTLCTCFVKRKHVHNVQQTSSQV